jgi:hypothetical protein
LNSHSPFEPADFKSDSEEIAPGCKKPHVDAKPRLYCTERASVVRTSLQEPAPITGTNMHHYMHQRGGNQPPLDAFPPTRMELIWAICDRIVPESTAKAWTREVSASC